MVAPIANILDPIDRTTIVALVDAVLNPVRSAFAEIIVVEIVTAIIDTVRPAISEVIVKSIGRAVTVVE